MLVENAGARLPMFINFVGETGRRKNIEGEILALRARNLRVAVDESQPDSTRNVRHQAAVWPNEIVTQSRGDAEIVILRPAKNRLGHCEEVNLIEAAQPAIAVNCAPTHSRGHELCADFVAVGISNDAEEVGRFGREFEAWSIELVGRLR